MHDFRLPPRRRFERSFLVCSSFRTKISCSMSWCVQPNDSQGAVEQFEVCLSICQKRTVFSVVLCMDVASEVFPGTMSLLFALSALCPAFLHTDACSYMLLDRLLIRTFNFAEACITRNRSRLRRTRCPFSSLICFALSPAHSRYPKREYEVKILEL